MNINELKKWLGIPFMGMAMLLVISCGHQAVNTTEATDSYEPGDLYSDGSNEQEAAEELAADEAQAEEAYADAEGSEEGTIAEAEEVSEEAVAEAETPAFNEEGDYVSEGEEPAAIGEDSAQLVDAPEAAEEDQVAMNSEEPTEEVVATLESEPIIDEPAQSEQDAMAPEVVDLSENDATQNNEAAMQAAPQKVVVSTTPEIPTEAIEKSGELLNRYYFVRQDDTPESVSQRIYGNEDNAEKLSAWNGRFRAGKIIYYISKTNPGDGQMKSYYEEGNIIPEGYEVQKGETLSSIAEAKYGHIQSWREIAVSNEIQNPDQVSAGSIVTLYPSNLSEYSAEEVASVDIDDSEEVASQLAALDNQPKPVAKASNIDNPGNLDETKNIDASIVDVQSPLAKVEKAPIQMPKRQAAINRTIANQKKSQASVGVAGFIQRNFIAILVGLILAAVGVFAYLFLGQKQAPDKF